MGSQTDDIKGRAKEAAGDLMDDRDLKQEGKTDQAGAQVKEKLEQVKGKGEEMVDKVKDTLHRDR